MQMVENAINWFEIPVNDFDRARRFYSTIFAFEMPVMVMCETKMGFLLYNRERGGVGGAIVEGLDHVPSKHGAKLYLNAGDDLQVVLDRVKAAGGKVVSPKTQITPEYGYFAVFDDSEGNQVSLHSPH